jgi:hypothetical protein
MLLVVYDGLNTSVSDHSQTKNICIYMYEYISESEIISAKKKKKKKKEHANIYWPFRDIVEMRKSSKMGGTPVSD